MADGTLAKVACIFFPLFVLNCVSKDSPFDHLFICTQAEEYLEFVNSVNCLRIFFFPLMIKAVFIKKRRKDTRTIQGRQQSSLK